MRIVYMPIVMLLAASVALTAQLQFDVASIRENNDLSLGDGGSLRLMPDGGITARHMAARGLISLAFRLERYQLVGAPEWTQSTYYDVTAKPAQKATRDQTFTMLQSLLVDRFAVKTHRERRTVDGFVLQRSSNTKLGPDLSPSPFNCQESFTSSPKCRDGGITIDSFHAFGAPLDVLIRVLAGQLSAPVRDETGLAGAFDVNLRWSNALVPNNEASSIFTAVQEQLGLKLERRRLDVDVVVVDHMDRPTPD